ncbi:MAG: sigma-54 dependent transcriptional regulator [Bacteroidales bacterium]
MNRVLVIDDDTYICKLLSDYLNINGYPSDSAFTGIAALKMINDNHYDLVISDFRLPDRDGFDILHHVKNKYPGTPVIIMTAYKDLAIAVRLIKSGAFNYVTKPLIHEELLELIKEATIQKEVHSPQISFQQDFIRGSSKNFKEILEHVRIVSPVDMSVIIEGETGSGKEFIARAIHYNSKRKDGPFIAVDCGALPQGLVNSELFGHMKGAFTGAIYDKKGLFEQADGGTLFLDEIGNLDAENQMKLLRVLQEKTVTPVGGIKSLKVDVRLLVATNEDLLVGTGNGKIREDLYHRLNEFKITVPPLRLRGEDVLVHADAFLNRAALRFDKQVQGYDQGVKNLLLEYSWPGNIRELKNVITRAVLLSKTRQITLNEIPDEIKTIQVSRSSFNTNLKDAASMAEKEAIIHALVKTNYNKSQAARYLKIDRKTLYNKIKQYNISLSDH